MSASILPPGGTRLVNLLESGFNSLIHQEKDYCVTVTRAELYEKYLTIEREKHGWIAPREKQFW